MGSDLGAAVKGFKDGVKGAQEDDAAEPAAQVGTHRSADANTVDVDAKTKS
jgi:sec-independent protein translocase protein TatA